MILLAHFFKNLFFCVSKISKKFYCLFLFLASNEKDFRLKKPSDNKEEQTAPQIPNDQPPFAGGEREITPELRPTSLGWRRKSDGGGAGAGGLPEAEEGAGDADGQPGSAGFSRRALHLLRPEHPAGAPQPQVLHRAASARHQPPLPRRLAPWPQGVLLFTRTSVSLLPWIYLSFRSLVVAGSRRGRGARAERLLEEVSPFAPLLLCPLSVWKWNW
jgi:hypothetical protein